MVRSVALLVVGIGFAGAASMVVARSNAAPGTVPSDIRAIFNRPPYKHAIWGLRVQDGANVLIDANSGRQFLIGSVRKIFSVGQLLNTVGAGHTYDTPVYRAGTITRGVLHGNLILVASGDLTMGGRTNPDGKLPSVTGITTKRIVWVMPY